MAIYHFKSQIIKRSAGRSATSAAAYRARTKIKDDRTGLTYDYGHIEKASYLKILAPDNVPDWVYDRARLWNEVELAEKRKDSQVAREIMVALPSELSRFEKIKLGVKFIRDNYVSKGMVADLAFHDLNTKNPHLHVMLTTRTIDIKGFGLKERSWNPSFKQKWASGDRLKEERQLWEKYTNSALAESGHQSRVDCRSLKDKGSELIPQVHLGAAVNALEKRGIRTELGDEHRRIAKANQEITRLKLELEAKKLEAEREKKKQQQELEQLRKRSQKDPDKSQTTLDLEQIIRLLKEKSIGSKSESDLSGKGFGKIPNKSTTNLSQNRSKTNDSKRLKPHTKYELGSSLSRANLPTKNTANNPENNPQNSNQNTGDFDKTIGNNRRPSLNYWKSSEDIDRIFSDWKNTDNKSATTKDTKPNIPMTSTESEQLSEIANTNAQDLLALGSSIYDLTPLQRHITISPGIWEVRGSSYTLRFDRNQNTFTISDLDRGILIEADLNQTNGNNIVVRSPVTTLDLKVFAAYFKELQKIREKAQHSIKKQIQSKQQNKQKDREAEL